MRSLPLHPSGRQAEVAQTARQDSLLTPPGRPHQTMGQELYLVPHQRVPQKTEGSKMSGIGHTGFSLSLHQPGMEPNSQQGIRSGCLARKVLFLPACITPSPFPIFLFF